MVRSGKNPDGLPMEVFDNIRKATAFDRAQFYIDLTVPFYGYDRQGAKVSEGLRRRWWRQGMMGGVLAQYECIKAFSKTDFTEDLKAIKVPTLIMHGDDDQIVPIANTALLAHALVKGSVLKVYPGLPHGILPPTRTRSTLTSSRSSRLRADTARFRAACSTARPLGLNFAARSRCERLYARPASLPQPYRDGQRYGAHDNGHPSRHGDLWPASDER